MENRRKNIKESIRRIVKNFMSKANANRIKELKGILEQHIKETIVALAAMILVSILAVFDITTRADVLLVIFAVLSYTFGRAMGAREATQHQLKLMKILQPQLLEEELPEEEKFIRIEKSDNTTYSGYETDGTTFETSE